MVEDLLGFGTLLRSMESIYLRDEISIKPRGVYRKNGVYSGNLHGRRKIHVEAKQKSVYSPRLHMAIGPLHILQLQFSSFQ
jgi:hypothetical protein